MAEVVAPTVVPNPGGSIREGAMYHDPDGWYSVLVPEGWQVKTVGSEVQFRGNPDNTVGFAVSLWPKMILPDTLTQKVTAVLRSKTSTYETLHAEERTLDGHPAQYIEHKYTFDDFAQKGFMIGTVLIILILTAVMTGGMKKNFQRAQSGCLLISMTQKLLHLSNLLEKFLNRQK